MYVLMNPMKPETADTSLPKEITWEYAQKEIAQVKGFATGSAGLSKGTVDTFSSMNFEDCLFFLEYAGMKFH
jgi:hypothetical protein